MTAGFLRGYPQLDGILAANDPMAIGAVDALKAAGRKSLVVGINASREVMDLHQVRRRHRQRRLRYVRARLHRGRDGGAHDAQGGSAA